VSTSSTSDTGGTVGGEQRDGADAERHRTDEPVQPHAGPGNVEHRPPDHVRLRDPHRVDRRVVVALEDVAGRVAAHDAVQHDQLVYVVAVRHDLAGRVRVRRRDDKAGDGGQNAAAGVRRHRPDS
jgi:DNA replication initiation complex subunit (GINS family)